MVLSLGVIAFTLNAVAQINMVHCVLAAFCVGVGISGPQEWLDLFGSSFDVYSVQRFWGYVCSNPDVLDLTKTLISRWIWRQLLHRVSFINVITYLTHANDRTSQPLKSSTIFVVMEVLHCLRGKPYAAFVFLNTLSFISGRIHVWTWIVGYVWVFLWFWYFGSKLRLRIHQQRLPRMVLNGILLKILKRKPNVNDHRQA